MKIIEQSYKWNGSLNKRASTKYIIIHHRAGNGDVQSIHKEHLNNGWFGIGYHFYIRTDGTIYRGRPIEEIGSHCLGKNDISIGICFEGNFEKEAMTMAQTKSGQEILSYLKSLYPNAEVKKHRDFQATACPGKNFPFEEIIKELTPANKRIETSNDIVWELNHSYFPINDINGFIKSLNDEKRKNSPLYWGYYKLVNKIRP